MEICLGGYNMKICIIYLDDLIISAKDSEEHQILEKLDLVLTMLKECNLKLSAEKFFFVQKSVHFLGHVVSDSGVETGPDKIKKVKNWPVPKNADELHSFKAFVYYYRICWGLFQACIITYRFGTTYSTKKKKSKRTQKQWNWTETEQDTFIRQC